MERQKVHLPEVVLAWSPWHPWPELRSSGRLIPRRPGVYDARRAAEDERLTIGKSTNLRARVGRLLRENGGHSEGRRIRAQEDVRGIVVRWAEAAVPAAVEEHLHGLHRERFGGLPRYVTRT